MKNGMMCFGVLLVIGVVTAQLAQAQQNGKSIEVLQLGTNASSPPARLEDVAWIAGHWLDSALGGIVEEVWTEPHGDSMMGMFKLLNNGKTSFYELLTIREVNGSLLLQLKHFNRDMTGWEKQNEVLNFPLVKITKQAVYFSGMTFLKSGEDQITVAVITDESKPSSPLVFNYRKRQ